MEAEETDPNEWALEQALGGIKAGFADITDPRVAGRTAHPVINIVVMALLAVMSGLQSWEGMERFGKIRKRWLGRFLDLPEEQPIPSDDTFRRVLGMLNPTEFSSCLFKWTQAMHAAVQGDVIAVDGKTLRGTCDADGQGGLHLVSAWAQQQGLTLGQVACEEKSNEITAIPALLRLLNIKGHTVTIDALGCQTEIVEQIRAQGGNYVICVKSNQTTLRRDVEQLYADATDSDKPRVSHRETHETAHGRNEERIYTAVSVPAKHAQRARWKDLNSILAVGNCRHEADGSEIWQTRYFISNLSANAKQLSTCVRGHWDIENKVHWTLDVAFREDSIRQYDRTAATNLAAIRKLALTLLRKETSEKASIRHKQMMCSLDPTYLIRVFKAAWF